MPASYKQTATHKAVTQQIVRRYVTSEMQREPGGVTKRGVRQLRHDISALRCELRDALPQQNPQLVPDLISFEDENPNLKTLGTNP